MRDKIEPGNYKITYVLNSGERKSKIVSVAELKEAINKLSTNKNVHHYMYEKTKEIKND